jgi:hypothetical protein
VYLTILLKFKERKVLFNSVIEGPVVCGKSKGTRMEVVKKNINEEKMDMIR